MTTHLSLEKETFKPASRRLKIYFSNGYYESSDDGDITTKNSYDTMNYKTDIQIVDGYRNTDIIDIRPKVSQYVVTENSRSPLEFFGRKFDGSGNSSANILKLPMNPLQLIIHFSLEEQTPSSVQNLVNSKFSMENLQKIPKNLFQLMMH